MPNVLSAHYRGFARVHNWRGETGQRPAIAVCFDIESCGEQWLGLSVEHAVAALSKLLQCLLTFGLRITMLDGFDPDLGKNSESIVHVQISPVVLNHAAAEKVVGGALDGLATVRLSFRGIGGNGPNPELALSLEDAQELAIFLAGAVYAEGYLPWELAYERMDEDR